MTSDIKLLFELIDHHGPRITFGDDSESKTMGMGNNIHEYYKCVLLVENLCYNLININQICDNWYIVEFHKHMCTIKNCSGNVTSNSKDTETDQHEKLPLDQLFSSPSPPKNKKRSKKVKLIKNFDVPLRSAPILVVPISRVLLGVVIS